MKTIKANFIDIDQQQIYGAVVSINKQKIQSIERDNKHYDTYICPGLIDAHIHIESSMLIPSEFARIAVQNGTVATVSDPHEIANVAGLDGINFMIENGDSVPFKFHWTAPSCVPATDFESSGARLESQDLEPIIKQPQVVALGEVMNFPAVIAGNPAVMNKIALAKKHHKKIDGHAPGVSGADLAKYIASGISTDHECLTLQEAQEKLSLGMKILIREGSAAKNFATLHSLISTDNKNVMLCTDDCHPDDLLSQGHINKIIKLGLQQGHNIYDLLRCCTQNVVEHYGLDVGLLKVGDRADFIVIDNPEDFNVIATYIDGEEVYHQGQVKFESKLPAKINNFKAEKRQVEDFRIAAKSGSVNIINALDGQLITEKTVAKLTPRKGFLESDLQQDILKLVVVNRYQKNATTALGFIKGFNLNEGALASSIAHDSHNIIAVGVSDQEIVLAVNKIIENKGGVAVVKGQQVDILELEYGGLMTAKAGEKVALAYEKLNQQAKNLGCKQRAPFMTLAFMSLLVIPKIKLGDRGLFDAERFQFTDLFL